MAVSNRDRIDRGMALLATGLAPFVDAAMSAVSPAGRDWVEVLQARDSARHGTELRYSRQDARFLLKVLTEEWRVFKDKLSRAEQSFASELRDVGNRWGHGEGFSADDAYRALDTMERLLIAADAAAEAEEVRRLRRDAQQAAFAAEARKAVASVAGVEGRLEGHGLKPWREVIIPHRDVVSGDFAGAEFAADLYYVSIGEGSREYTDPVEFFRRTYLTEGLKDLLVRAARRVGGDRNASPVVNLQTNFGGGKTHSMLALWHLLSGVPLAGYPDELQQLLAGHDIGALGRDARRVALVGNHIRAGKGSVKGDGTHVRTLWGELAWQLGSARGGQTGAREAYAVVADADATRSNPGDALGELIRRYAPCLILIDEWVAYARQLFGRDDLDGGTFDTQFTFAQTLTEAVKATPGAMLVVSIPASSDVASDEEKERGATDIEVGGTNGRAALDRLQQVIRRIADQWRPATHHESFAIVRQRLFERPAADARADIAAVARVFTGFYARHRGEFPAEVSEPAYEERIAAAYPIHPELFDRLYQDWSTLERFQRTRGVLRLMSAVIHALWQASDPAPLIMPGGVPLDAERVRSELTQYLEDDFKPVIDTDIDGAGSTPARVDASRTSLGQRKVTRRIARTIFLGSAPTLKAAHRGIEQPHIWLGTAVPGDTVGNFGSALHLLSDQATFLYSDHARYWYATQASVAKMARDYADRLREHPDQAQEEILRRLRERETSSRGMFARVQAGPEGSAEIPDEPLVRLVILRPDQTHARGDAGSKAMAFANNAMQSRGNSLRMNRNMIVFLAPDAKRAEELDQAAREYLAWKSINDRCRELDLSTQQAAQAEKKLTDADQTVNLRITATYQWLLVPAQRDARGALTLDESKADTARDRLAERASDRLHRDDRLRAVHGARNIRIDLDQHLASVWQRGHIRAGDLWDYYCRYVYLPRLRDRSVLEAGILDVFSVLTWETEGFAVAAAYDEAAGRYLGLAIPQQDTPPQVTDATLLVAPALAIAQRDRELAERAAARAAPGGGADMVAGTAGGTADTGAATAGGPPGPGTAEAGASGGGPQPSGPRNTRFFGVATVSSALYMKDLTRISQEVIRHLAASDDVDLEIKLEISARSKDGYPDDKVRIVTENARTLKFDSYGFEDR
jgi:predicted AAA+ superfamily ATPase